MARRKPAVEPLPTIWRTPDDLWNDFVVPLLHEHDPEPKTGRPRIDQRNALDGMIFVLRSGCQWNALPEQFGDGAMGKARKGGTKSAPIPRIEQKAAASAAC